MVSDGTRRLLLRFCACLRCVSGFDLVLGLLSLAYMAWTGYDAGVLRGGLVLAGAGTFGLVKTKQWKRELGTPA